MANADRASSGFQSTTTLEGASNNTSTADPALLPSTNNGSVIAGIILFLLAAAGAAACIWLIKRKKSRRRRRQYMASARKVSQGQEALDLDKPRPDRNKEEELAEDDDVILQNVNQVFESPPLQLKEPSVEVSFGDRVLNSVAHLFGSKIPLGAARVRTTTGSADAAEAGAADGAEEGAAPIVVNGRIQALYDEIMKPDQAKPGDYGILQEEVTPEAARRRSARRSTSFRPASELSTVSEVSLELMDREISTELMVRGPMMGASMEDFDQKNLDLILKGSSHANEDNDSLGLGIGEGGDDVSGVTGISSISGGGDGELADELESSLPSTAGEIAAGMEINSTGFITDKQNPNKYYSIAYTDYFMDD